MSLSARLLMLAAALSACTGDSDGYSSEPTEPTREFEVDFPEVDTDWPLGLEPDVSMDPVPFTGDWVDGFDTSHTITDERWETGSAVFDFVEVDADAERIIARNGEENAFNPGLWSRFDWIEVDGVTWFCQSAFDAESADAAREVARADDSDPANGGCGGSFAWSRLYEPLPIRGDWVDNFGGSHSVREWRWTMGESTVFDVSAYDVEDGWIVAQNGADNEFSPDLWSRFEWAQVDDALYFCQVAFAAETEADALAAGPADASDPANGGCGGFSWSALTPAE